MIRSCASCTHLALPSARDYMRADADTREQMLDDAWCLKLDSEPAPGGAGCNDYEPAKLTVASSAPRMVGSGDWFYGYAKAKDYDVDKPKRWPPRWEHLGWCRAFRGEEEGE